MKYISYEIYLDKSLKKQTVVPFKYFSFGASQDIFISEDGDVYIFRPDIRSIISIPTKYDFFKLMFKIGSVVSVVDFKAIKKVFSDHIDHNEIFLFGDMAELSHHVNMWNKLMEEQKEDMVH